MVVSSDVTFDESLPSNRSTSFEEVPANDVVVHGEDAKVEDNIDPTDNTTQRSQTADEEASDNEFEDSHDNTPPQPRSSGRIRKQSGEWCKFTSLLSHALSARVWPTSFKSAQTP